jgi:phosphoglycerate dehydrogenase-like enzyme
MYKIAILDDYQNKALDSASWDTLAGTDATAFNHYIDNENALIETLTPFDIVVAMRERTRFPSSILERLDNLKLLVTAGMRNYAIDMDFAKSQGIVVCGTPMVAHSTYEHAWALILALSKKIPQENAVMHTGGWQAEIGIGLKGKTLGILGLGRLGAYMARIAQAFEMKVIAWSENLSTEKAAEHNVLRVDKETLFAESDILTIHLVLSERTQGLVGAKELDSMKPSAYLVNTSRGPIVDEQALLASLTNNKIAGAGIDVFGVEPLPSNHPFRNLDNAILTGHTGYVVQELYEVVYGQAVKNIESWQNGKPENVLNS